MSGGLSQYQVARVQIDCTIWIVLFLGRKINTYLGKFSKDLEGKRKSEKGGGGKVGLEKRNDMWLSNWVLFPNVKRKEKKRKTL
ncbi:hypothetical protein [Devosia indica]